MRIINEPTAAALAYGLSHSSNSNDHILVIDTGGGTMDFTILEKTLQQLADLTAGKAQFQTPMGGPTLTATNVAQVQQLLVELKTMKQ